MAKRKAHSNQTMIAPTTRAHSIPRRRQPLILPRYLKHEANLVKAKNLNQKDKHNIIIKWADLEFQGDLQRKETSLDADFLNEIFGDVLGYQLPTNNPEKYNLLRHYTVPGVGEADGALGNFGRDQEHQPTAVIELKDSNTNLDRDKFNGRTAVQQCWDYLNAFPDCHWGIVSNFVTFRLYYVKKTTFDFEYFTLQALRSERTFWEFFTVFSREGLLSSFQRKPITIRLIEDSDKKQREVSDELYESYSHRRLALIDHLHHKHNKKINTAIAIAQKIMDRIIFVAFCEDRGLLPEDTIETSELI